MTLLSMARVPLLIAALVLPWAAATPAAAADGDAPLVVFLVRHAEKVLGAADPPLTPEGGERAALLAATLRDSRIERVHSSDYLRTRDTAAPVAARLGLDVELYDAGDLEALAEQLKAAGGRHLVVGHSNTTPALVGLLGGDPGTPIEEGHEYDRLYVVTVGADGTVSTLLLRYGRPPGEY